MMKGIYNFLLLCSLLMLTACSQDENLMGEEIEITSLSVSLPTGQTRAVDADGFNGVVKEEFVAGDKVTIYKDGTWLCEVKCKGGGNWEAINPALKFIKGKRSTVKISYNNDEIYATAVYDRSAWKSEEAGCWGTISTANNSLTAVLNYSKALVTVKQINTTGIGNIAAQCVEAVIDDTNISLVSVDKEDWLWEQLSDADKTITEFNLTLTDGTSIPVPLETSVSLEANKQYTFNITLELGRYYAWLEGKSILGTPPGWVNNPNSGELQKIIKDRNELKGIINDLGGRYILGANIDLNGSEWTPIGESADEAFTGEFDGNGYVINNLTISESNDYAGLFGYVKGATIMNLHVGNVKINTTGIAAGAIAGCAENTVFDLCSTSSNNSTNNIVVTGKDKEAGVYAGGIVGLLYEEADGENFSKLMRCWDKNTVVKADGTASQQSAHCGGIVGRNNYGGLVSCYSYNVDSYAAGSTSASNNAGGLIGSSITDGRNLILAYGCCAREKYSESKESVENNAGDLIGVVEGPNTVNIGSCWAWKNDKHESSENLDHDFIVKYPEGMTFENLDNCLEHDCDMTDFVKLHAAGVITFYGKTWNPKGIWEISTKPDQQTDLKGFPQINLSYSGE